MILRCNFPPEVQEWIDIVENETFKVCKEQKQLVKHIKKCFEQQAIYIDVEQMQNYFKIIKRYVPFDIFPWQKFVIALHDCTYWKENGEPRWSDLFAEIGRGAGKDGTIAIEALCLSSPYNGIREYDIDICANDEVQAKRPVQDLINFFEIPDTEKKIKRFYHWTKEQILCTRTGAVIKGRTNSPKSKDGMRSGIVIFNEIHRYENYDNIDVFTTGLGKKPHPRRSFYTTNGDVREGPLDDLFADAQEILNSESVDDNGLLPFICKLDSAEEVREKENWTKANPSLPYLPHLQKEIEKEFNDWTKKPDRASSFMTKRMNINAEKKETAVTDWDKIKATDKPIPYDELKGCDCVIGIDYSRINDFASVDVHFKIGDNRYDINETWFCLNSADKKRLKIPWEAWAKNGKLNLVDAVEIHPDILTDFVLKMCKKYNVKKVCIDTYRYALLSSSLARAGVSRANGNLCLVKQRDIIQTVPIIDSCFNNDYFTWGDNPCLRWATNNTKVIRYGRDVGADKGSFVYAKIEAKSRKTDPFMALVAAMTQEGEIKEKPKLPKNFHVITF